MFICDRLQQVGQQNRLFSLTNFLVWRVFGVEVTHFVCPSIHHRPFANVSHATFCFGTERENSCFQLSQQMTNAAHSLKQTLISCNKHTENNRTTQCYVQVPQLAQLSLSCGSHKRWVQGPLQEAGWLSYLVRKNSSFYICPSNKCKGILCFYPDPEVSKPASWNRL